MPAQKGITSEQFIEVYNKFKHLATGVVTSMAKELNVHHSTISKRMKTFKSKGLIPLDSGVQIESSQILKGTSTLYKSNPETGEPEPVMQWVKTDTEKEAVLDTFQEAVDTIVNSHVKPSLPIKQRTINTSDDLLVKYPFADAHIGLLTWHKEVGEDFDLEIAKKVYTEAIQRLVVSAPAASTALILDLGDTIHTDDSTNQTKASKHILDVDGRFDKLFDMALHILVTIIDLVLQKHDKVIFRKTRGNHDPDTSVAIGAFLEAYYKDNPRVIIERTPSLFWYYKFGKTLHFSTHGHTTKQKDLPEIAAHDCKKVWSDVDFVYIDTGHIHHQNIIETRVAICESHNSGAVGDSYNFGHGYRSKRNMKAIVYHKTKGEIGRNIVDINTMD